MHGFFRERKWAFVLLLFILGFAADDSARADVRLRARRQVAQALTPDASAWSLRLVFACSRGFRANGPAGAPRCSMFMSGQRPGFAASFRYLPCVEELNAAVRSEIG